MVKPHRGRTSAELLAWAAAIVAREQDRGTYGSVVVQMEAGRVVRVRVESVEMPPDEEN